MTAENLIRVVLVDDHFQMHRIVQEILTATDDIRLVGQGAHGQEGIELCEQYQPDIVLMDVVMPIIDGIEATKVLHTRMPDLKILVLSSHQDHESVYSMLRNGAVGYLTKGSLAEDLTLQTIPNPGMPDDLFALEKAIWATTGYFSTGGAEMDALLGSAAEVRAMRITSFGNLPLSVLSAGLHPPLPSLSDAENQEFWSVQEAMQSELAALSSNGTQTIAEQSGHAIQFDQPELVLDAIRQILEAAQ